MYNRDQPRDANGRWRPFITPEGQLDFTAYPTVKTQGSLLYPPRCDTAEELISFYLEQEVPEHVVGMARSLYRYIHDNDAEVKEWVNQRMAAWVEANPRPDKKDPFRYRNGRHAEEIQAWLDAYDREAGHYSVNCPLHPPDLPRYGAPMMVKVAFLAEYAGGLSEDEQRKVANALLDWNGEIDTIANKGNRYLLIDLGTALTRFYQWQGTETKPNLKNGIATNPLVSDVYTNPTQYASLRSKEES